MNAFAGKSHANKRKHVTFALLALFLLLIGLIGWMELRDQSSNREANEIVERITIKRKGHSDIRLNRIAERWRITAPYSLNANSQRVEPLLTLANAQFNTYEKNQVDMRATGLDAPAATLILGEREFALGLTDIEGDRRYALVDHKVALLPEWVWSLIHGGVTAFADLQVFDQLPDSLYLINETETRLLESREQWAVLQADNISAWTTDFNANQEAGADVGSVKQWLLSGSETASENSKLADILRFEDRTLIKTQAGYAYALSNARFDALLGL